MKRGSLGVWDSFVRIRHSVAALLIEDQDQGSMQNSLTRFSFYVSRFTPRAAANFPKFPTNTIGERRYTGNLETLLIQLIE